MVTQSKNLGIVKAVSKAINESVFLEPTDRFWTSELAGSPYDSSSPSAAYSKNRISEVDSRLSDELTMSQAVEYGNYLKRSCPGVPS